MGGEPGGRDLLNGTGSSVTLLQSMSQPKPVYSAYNGWYVFVKY